MEEREAAVRLWFEMWLRQEDLGIDGLFAPEALYIESWGPEYKGRDAIRHWFREWNSRGKVVVWDIRQFFHKGDQTVAEWSFKAQMSGGGADEFDGLTLIRWTPEGKIKLLKEFGCNIRRYDPYQKGPFPEFREEPARWF